MRRRRVELTRRVMVSGSFSAASRVPILTRFVNGATVTKSEYFAQRTTEDSPKSLLARVTTVGALSIRNSRGRRPVEWTIRRGRGDVHSWTARSERSGHCKDTPDRRLHVPPGPCVPIGSAKERAHGGDTLETARSGRAGRIADRL